MVSHTAVVRSVESRVSSTAFPRVSSWGATVAIVGLLSDTWLLMIMVEAELRKMGSRSTGIR